MQDLRVVGVEDGTLLLSSESGERYRADVDVATLAQLRRAARPPEVGERRVPPKEIQAHIRAGMSARDVADVTGAPLEQVQRFEGAVLAEREHVLGNALRVRVHTAADIDPTEGQGFGSVIRGRLSESGARAERWTAWKDPESGWTIELTFISDTTEHVARWSFEPRTQALAPLTAEAISLSQQGEAPPGLIPRLRAVPFTDGDRGERSMTGRFDSGAFAAPSRDRGMPETATGPAGGTGEVTPVPLTQTADLLEALRRRRGERDGSGLEFGGSAHPSARAVADHPPTSTIRLVELPLDGLSPDEQDSPDDDRGAPTPPESASVPPAPGRGGIQPPTHATAAARGSRKGRATMPSWDEIVFGARSDD